MQKMLTRCTPAAAFRLRPFASLLRPCSHPEAERGIAFIESLEGRPPLCLFFSLYAPALPLRVTGRGAP